MRRSNFILGLLAPLPALAQPVAPIEFCGGRLRAERFESTRNQAPPLRAVYSMQLRNLRNEAVTFVVQFTGNALDRPLSAPRSLASFATATVALGYQPILPGGRAMTMQELPESVRISCR